jgi:hypothetical protein
MSAWIIAPFDYAPTCNLDAEGRLLCQDRVPKATALDTEMIGLKKSIKQLAYKADHVDDAATTFEIPHTCKDIAASLLSMKTPILGTH